MCIIGLDTVEHLSCGPGFKPQDIAEKYSDIEPRVYGDVKKRLF